MLARLGRDSIVSRKRQTIEPSSLGAFRAAYWLCVALLVASSSGCGAVSVRLGAGPAIASRGQVAIESTFSLGFGMPFDFKGRSQHYLQGLAFVGGAADVDSDTKMPTVGLGADYIYWAHPRFDLRTGAYFVYRNRKQTDKELDLFGLGAHLALMPVLTKNNSNINVPQVCLGPEFRVDQSWDSNSPATRSYFTVPLVLEVNLLVAGD